MRAQEAARPPYEGNDMAGYMMERGFKFHDSYGVKSITNVRDTAIIVTDWAIWRAKPDYYTGFSVEMLVAL